MKDLLIERAYQEAESKEVLVKRLAEIEEMFKGE